MTAPTKTDHDKIIDSNKEIELLYLKLEVMDNETTKRLDRIENKMDNFYTDCSKTFINSKTFWIVCGAIFTLIVGAYSYINMVVFLNWS